ncbi:MAG: YdbH domain-containing protein [Alphaproteobacteria bacterium]|nr:YdbH domain-containing protein [Alphaproteobacteria bacterium]
MLTILMFKKLPRPSFRFVLVAGAVAAIAVVIFSSEFLGARLCERLIRQNGFPEARIADFSLSPSGIFIDTLSLDRSEFSTAEGISIQLSWIDFLTAHHIESVKVKDISLAGEMSADGQYKIAGWDASFPSFSTAQESSGARVGSVLIDGINIDMDTDYGNIRLSGKISYQDNSQSGESSFQSNFWAKQKQLGFSASINGHKKKTDPSWIYSCEWQDGRIDLPHIQASRLSGWVDFGDTSKAGQISAGSVKHQNMTLQNLDIVIDTAKEDMAFFKTSPAGFPNVVLVGVWNKSSDLPIRFEVSAQKPAELLELFGSEPKAKESSTFSELPPLTLEARSSWDRLSLASEVTADWTLRLGKGEIKANGTAGFEKETGVTKIHLNPSSLDASALTFFPALTDDKLSITTGQIKVTGDLLLSANSPPKGPMSFAFENIGGSYDQTPFEGLTGILLFTDIAPSSWRIDPAAEFSLKRAGKGNILENGKISLTGDSQTGLLWKKADFDLGGGSLSLHPFSQTKGSIRKSQITLRDVDMEKLIKIAEVDGLEGNGKIEGVLPVELGPQGFIVKGGLIKNSGDGEFRYAPVSFPTALQGDDQRMKTVREALSHFKFTQLELSIDGPLEGSLKTTLKAKGTNPRFDDRPIELNINLEGALGSALSQVLNPSAFTTDKAQNVLKNTKPNSP